jgi:hypothetical protein
MPHIIGLNNNPITIEIINIIFILVSILFSLIILNLPNIIFKVENIFIQQTRSFKMVNMKKIIPPNIVVSNAPNKACGNLLSKI